MSKSKRRSRARTLKQPFASGRADNGRPAQAPTGNGHSSDRTRTQRVSKKQRRLEEQAKAARLKQIRAVGLVVIGLALVVGLAFWRNAGVVPAEELEVTPNLDGPADAPVRIVEFGDFGCPSCRAWHNAGIHQQLKEDYGDQLAIEFRHFPVITPQSPQAAEAAQCAGEQDAFWAYHDYLYEQTPQGALSIPDLKTYAVAIGLDQEAFDSCLDSGKYGDYIIQEMRAAQAAGARGTPSFFIDGQPISFSYAGMSAAIEAALANQ